MNSELFQNTRRSDSEVEPELLINPQTPDSIISELERHLSFLYRQESQSRNLSQFTRNWKSNSASELSRSQRTDQIQRPKPRVLSVRDGQTSQTLPLFKTPAPRSEIENLNKGFAPLTTPVSDNLREQHKLLQNVGCVCSQKLSGLLNEREGTSSGLESTKHDQGKKRTFDTYACDIFRELLVLNIMMHYLRDFQLDLPNPLAELSQSVFRAFSALPPQKENCNKAQSGSLNVKYTSLSVHNQLNACRVIIANQLLINCLEGEAERIKMKNLSKSTQPLQDELVALKIKKQKLDLMSELEEVPSMEQVVFRGNPRQALRRNGTPFVSSNFRGVCRNGSRFQLFLMVDGKNKLYRGGFRDPLTAAKLYDRASIQLRGLAAKTNFDYTKEDVIEILSSQPVFDVYTGSKASEEVD